MMRITEEIFVHAAQEVFVDPEHAGQPLPDAPQTA